MDTVQIVGGVLLVLGLVGYLTGIVAPYPGRGFSLTGIMVGITLLAVGGR